MSSSIRPPGAGPAAGPAGPAGLDGVSEALKPDAPASVGAVQGEAQAAASESPTGAWLRRLSAGEVSREQAVEGLVAQALEAHGGARLSAAQRSELADVLREALLGDPVLGQLLGA